MTIREEQCAKCTNKKCECKECRGISPHPKCRRLASCGFKEYKRCDWKPLQ